MSEPFEGFVPYQADLAEDYRRKGHWKDSTFGEYLDDWVARYGERIAVVAGGVPSGRRSYPEGSRSPQGALLADYEAGAGRRITVTSDAPALPIILAFPRSAAP